MTSKPIEPEQTGGVHYFQEQLSATVHHFYLSGEIGPAINYIEMIHAIRMAPPNDVIKLHLNTTGGQLDTGIQIINAMRESMAHIICVLEAQAYSMGSLIFLSGNEFVVQESSVLMIHNFSGGVFGKGHEQRSRLEAVSEWFEGFSHPLYVPFISQEEFDMVIDGKDMWIHTDEIETRLNAMIQSKIEPAIKNAPVTKKKPRSRKKTK